MPRNIFKSWKAFRRGTRDWVKTLGSFGYAVKGVLSLVIGVLAIQGVYSYARYKAGAQGAIMTIFDWPFGKVYVAVIICGLIAYSAWRFLQVLTDPENDGNDASGRFNRVVYLFSGLTYSFLAWWTIHYAATHEEGSDNKELISKILSMPGGEIAVALAGLGAISVAVMFLVMAVKASFMEDYKHEKISRAQRLCYLWVGRLGILGRTSLFAMAGCFLIVAAFKDDPEKAQGLESGLNYLADSEIGGIYLVATAAGLIFYGLYCFSQTAHKRFVTRS